MEDVGSLIEVLKRRLGVTTDVELAKRLAVDKSTVSSWRSRNTLPKRYLGILTGEDAQQTIATPPIRWAEHEEYAFRLALFRLAKALGPDASSGDYGRAWKAFRTTGGFWKLMRESQKDLAEALDSRVSSIETAFALIMHDDVTAGEAATERDAKLLAGEG